MGSDLRRPAHGADDTESTAVGAPHGGGRSEGLGQGVARGPDRMSRSVVGALHGTSVTEVAWAAIWNDLLMESAALRTPCSVLPMAVGAARGSTGELPVVQQRRAARALRRASPGSPLQRSPSELAPTSRTARQLPDPQASRLGLLMEVGAAGGSGQGSAARVPAASRCARPTPGVAGHPLHRSPNEPGPRP